MADNRPPEPPSGYVPGEPTTGLAEKRRIIRERRLLRRDMKAKGIYTRKDFNILAESLNLNLWRTGPVLLWLHQLATGFGLKSLLLAGTTLLGGMFLYSTITEEKGAFTINLTGDMLKAGFILSESSEFTQSSSRLFSDKIEKVNNITIENIADNVDEIDGPHNGKNYMAYTFYIKNDGKNISTYAWYFKMTAELNSVSEAVWIMLFEDGRQVTYTRPTAAGTPEELYGFDEPVKFSHLAYDEAQYYERFDEEAHRSFYGITTTPYVDDTIVAQGIIQNTEPGEVHKYTVVIWVEGHDPECTNDLFGGFAKFRMEFEHVESSDDHKHIFDGLYRTEYDDYMSGGFLTAPAETEDDSDPESESGEAAETEETE